MKNSIIKNIRTHDIAPFLQKLIQIPTVNPPGNEAACARPVAAKLAELGFKVNLYEAEKDRTSVVGVLKGAGGGRDFLIYSGHLDVVPPGDLKKWHYPPFEGKIENGKIHGRGTADHKGTIVSSLFAIQSVIESGIRLKGDIVFVAAADEEMLGRRGSAFLVKNNLIYGDMGIAPIPASGKYLGIASMGYLWAKITVHGKEVHGAFPQEGINAIDKASNLITRLHSLKFRKKMPIMPTRGSTGFLSVTKINSGVKTNIIPGEAELTLDRRLVPGETPKEALKQLRNVIKNLYSKDKDFRADIEILDSDIGTLISKNEPIVKILGKNISEILGITAKVTGFPGISDNRYFINQAKIPMVSYGPGGYGPNGEITTHVPNEYICISELVDFAKVLAATILDICGYEA